MAEEVSISSVSASSLETQIYSSQDINLLNEFELNRDFGAEQDIIEYHIFDPNNSLLGVLVLSFKSILVFYLQVMITQAIVLK